MSTDSTYGHRARDEIRAMIDKTLAYIQCTRHDDKPLTNPQQVPLWESIHNDLREAELACQRLKIYFADAAVGLNFLGEVQTLEDVSDLEKVESFDLEKERELRDTEFCPSCGCPECKDPTCNGPDCPRCGGEYCDFHGSDPCECATDERHQLTRGDDND